MNRERTRMLEKKILNIAVIAGDGIGKEVTPEAQSSNEMPMVMVRTSSFSCSII